jgi:excisionase family DNA binding protein
MAAAVVGEIRLGLSVPEVAVALGISVRSVWKLIACGALRAKKAGRRTIVELDGVKAYLANLPAAGPDAR